MKCMYSGVFIFIDTDVATALPITLSHSVIPQLNSFFFFSGYATFSQDQQSLLISDLVNGIDTYSISNVSPGVSPTLLQSFHHSIHSNVPLQVTSGMQGNWVIGGSDDGSVRIFDQCSGDFLKCLRHGNGMHLS